jgi:hypothetical protein
LKKNMINRTLLLCLSLLVLVISLVPIGFSQAAGTDPSVTGLQRIGQVTDPSKPAADKLVLAPSSPCDSQYKLSS